MGAIATRASTSTACSPPPASSRSSFVRSSGSRPAIRLTGWWCARRGDEFVASSASYENSDRRCEMGEIHVHEFMTLDGVIDAPTWTFDFGFDPQMGEAIGAFTARCAAILLGRTTYEMFEPAWSTRTVEDDPGAPFFNDTTKYVVSSTLTAATW